jgi:sarcosine oxidase subunit beta
MPQPVEQCRGQLCIAKDGWPFGEAQVGSDDQAGLLVGLGEDVHPIVVPTDVDGFWVANGFSGHGLKLAPAIGSMVSKAITGDTQASDTEIPLSFFSINREPIELESKFVLAR